MVKQLLIGIITIAGCVFPTKAYSQYFENIQLKAYIKKANQGKMQSLEMTTYFGVDGKMVSIYEKPDNIVIINNEKGNVTIYDRRNNTLVTSDNPYYSTRSNDLYYFLNNKKEDLGLSEMGFTVQNTLFENGFIVTNWSPPEQGKAYFSKIKLVHDNYNPIYVEYADENDQIVKKIFFSAYETFNYIELPKTITSIDFKTQNDSIVTRTTFDQIIFDSSETTDKLNFQIPSNAKLIK
ncbi:MAG: hypothetical protein ACJAT1_000556 [Marivirga sp.]|jgi:hypothetical protein